MHFLALIGSIVTGLASIGLAAIDILSSPSEIDARAFLTGEPTPTSQLITSFVIDGIIVLVLLVFSFLSLFLFIKRINRGYPAAVGLRIVFCIIGIVFILGGGFFALGSGMALAEYDGDISLANYEIYNQWMNALYFTISLGLVVQGLGLFKV